MKETCKIKLCGLRSEADVQLAVELGVDAVGFVLTESPRQVAEEQCRHLRRLVPSQVAVHGVFAADAPGRIRKLVQTCQLDIAQVHGPEDDPAFWETLSGLPLIRAYRVRDRGVLSLLRADPRKVFLLDAYVPGKPGGTGETFDWGIAREATALGKVILAGGLTPQNVAAAVGEARPWMVDTSGGIEKEKGVKDHDLMRAFVKAVRAVDPLSR